MPTPRPPRSRLRLTVKLFDLFIDEAEGELAIFVLAAIVAGVVIAAHFMPPVWPAIP